MSCLALGDSIALGLAAALHCHAIATKGIGPTEWNQKHPGPFSSDVVIISLASNDDSTKKVTLLETRSRIKSGIVVWVIPHRNAQVVRDTVPSGDLSVSFVPRADRVHPKSYQTLANSVRYTLRAKNIKYAGLLP